MALKFLNKLKMMYLTAVCLLCVFLAGCSVKKYDETKQNDVDFTVLSEEEIPEQVSEIIETSKTENFRKTYSDKDYLYIIIGYGAQPTSSYSIEIQELYESSDALYITSMLKGPSRTEKVLEIETYPYIVVKVQHTDKAVVFQ
ncbi:MAG: protease complex subunit PrcB family protein [Lachnospiraceae bacterium]|nr:protease complex subunit PrcB family protein [Lachnospiraceae bacterium]